MPWQKAWRDGSGIPQEEVWCGTRESPVARQVGTAAGLGLTLGELLIREMLARCSRLVINPPFRPKD